MAEFISVIGFFGLLGFHLLLCSAIARWAVEWGHSGALLFVSSFLLTPIVAAMAVLALGKAGKTCNACSETIKASALRCRYCHSEQTVATVTPPSAVASSDVW